MESHSVDQPEFLQPGPKALEKGRVFTAKHPKISGYRAEYYKIQDSEMVMDAAKAEVAVSLLAGKEAGKKSPQLKASVSFKDLENDESLAKASLAVCSYQEWALNALIEHLKGGPEGEGSLDETTTLLLQSLATSGGHVAQLNARIAGNMILHRRDALLATQPAMDVTVSRALRHVSLSGNQLFNSQIPQALAISSRLSSLDMSVQGQGGDKGSKKGLGKGKGLGKRSQKAPQFKSPLENLYQSSRGRGSFRGHRPRSAARGGASNRVVSIGSQVKGPAGQ